MRTPPRLVSCVGTFLLLTSCSADTPMRGAGQPGPTTPMGGRGGNGGRGGAGGMTSPGGSGGMAGSPSPAGGSGGSTTPTTGGADAGSSSDATKNDATLTPVIDPPPPPAGDFPSAACTAKANQLLAMMTMDEKAAQMIQIERKFATEAAIVQYGVGSIFSEGGSRPSSGNGAAPWAAMTDQYRMAALRSRLKIPIIYGIDAVHGVGPVSGAVVFPHQIGLGATRNAKLLEDIGKVTAKEMRGCGLDFAFAPVVGVALDERWGRTYESYGETTDLASMLGAANIRGLQGTRLGGSPAVLACAKHYLGDGGTKDGRDRADTSGDETKLRALHLEPYRHAVAAGTGSIMVSFSSWQGVKMHENKKMITDVLKGELKFGGFVLSDYDAIGRITYDTAITKEEKLSRGINAGIDMFMASGRSSGEGALGDVPEYVRMIKSLVPARVPQARIDDAVRRILAVKCEMKLFENPGLADRTLTAQVGSAEHRMLGRQAVRESLVVLKNEGNVLPLKKTEKLALGGRNADNLVNQCGGWTIGWQMADNAAMIAGGTTIRKGIEAAAGAANVVFSELGTSTTGAKVGVAVIGETPYAENQGDAHDQAAGDIPRGGKQRIYVRAEDVAVVQAMKNAGLKVVVVLVSGRPMIIDKIVPLADAIVAAWLPGSEGAGVADVLFGDYKPSGKLPHSWPAALEDIPINDGDGKKALFPFGHGLTY